MNFLRTGRLGPVGLGMSTDEVLAALGEPEAVGGFSRKHRRPRIFKFGCWELHFFESKVWLIFTDTDTEFIGRTPSEMRQILEEHGIGFRGDDELLVTEAGVELRFTPLLGSVSLRERPLDGVGQPLLP